MNVWCACVTICMARVIVIFFTACAFLRFYVKQSNAGRKKGWKKGKRVSNEWEKKQIANTNEPLHNLSYSFLFSHCHSNRFQSFSHFSPLHAWIRNELCKCSFLWTRISHYITRCCLNVCKYMASIYFVVPRNALQTHHAPGVPYKWQDRAKVNSAKWNASDSENGPRVPIDVHRTSDCMTNTTYTSLSLKWICCV